MRSLPIEYYVLDVASEGPIIGYLNEQPVPSTVVDRAGHTYRYAGLIPRRPDGGFEVRSLQPGEWIVKPGLVYAMDR
jgi:hypothetical protein